MTSELTRDATGWKPIPRQRGSILIVVMIVLLVSGLLATQTLQLLWAAKQAHRQSDQIQQARQLVELGLAVAEQGRVPESGTLLIDVDGVPGSITFQPLSDDGSLPIKQPRYRIIAVYGHNGKNQATATGESRLNEDGTNDE